MVIRSARYNLILWSWTVFLAIVVAGSLGCQTPKHKDQEVVSVLALHLETRAGPSEPSKEVQIFRSAPMVLTIQSAPFLGEGLLESAKVVDLPGGFGMQIKYERRGAWLLEQYTSANRGKRMAIYVEFSPDVEKPAVVEKRWLAAPMITRTATNGVVEFTPDATRQETEAIVLGLNNLVREINKQ
jgi:hypothetical protein